MLKFVVLVAIAASAANADRLDIIGGKEVDPVGNYPWQAALTFDDQLSCGASIISSHWVLTAAHCVFFGINGYGVLIGAHDIDGRSQGNPVTYPATTGYGHPSWNWNIFDGNDIGLVYVEQEMDIGGNGFAGVIPMAEEGSDWAGAECVITGWGRYSVEPSLYPDALQEAAVVEVDLATCSSIHDENIASDVICVSGEFERGACHGDSGGPLVCKQNGEFVLVGDTSGGSPVCDTAFPTLYIRVSAHRQWINEISGL